MKIKALIIVALIAVTSFAQKSDPPATRLNAEASSTWKRIDQAEQVENERHQREIDRLNELRVVMLQAAGVPKDAWAHCVIEAAGTVACFKPATAAASPEKK